MGKIDKGFDFLGFHITRSKMGMATESIKRLGKKLLLFLYVAMYRRRASVKQFFVPRGDDVVGKQAVYVEVRPVKPPDVALQLLL